MQRDLMMEERQMAAAKLADVFKERIARVGVKALDGSRTMSNFERHDGQALSRSQDAACRSEEVATWLLNTNGNDKRSCSHHRCERLLLPVQPM